MKKVWRIILIVSLALIILGAALFGVSLITGGSFAAIQTHGEVTDYLTSVLETVKSFLP